MTGKPPTEEQRLFRPNYKAYAFVVLFTAVMTGIYWLGLRAVHNLGQATIPGGLRSHYIMLEVVICALAWFYVVENLLRHYQVDEAGLTVYRILLPVLRYSWEQIVHVHSYGYGDGFRLTIAGRGHLMVMLECLTQGHEMAGYIQRMAGKKPHRTG